MDFTPCSVLSVRKRLCNYMRAGRAGGGGGVGEGLVHLPFHSGARGVDLCCFDFLLLWFSLDVIILSFVTYTFGPFFCFLVVSISTFTLPHVSS